MRVLISGAGGLVGSAISSVLRERGDEVAALVRGEPHGDLDVRWDPVACTVDQDALRSGRFDAVIHLAGEPLLGRWTDEKRRAIKDSRVQGTGTIARALAELDESERPASLLVASATGWYGDRGDELLLESSASGGGFLGEVATAWEQAADPARAAGIRTVHMRMGIAQSRHGGALKLQLLPFRLGVGGRVGSGRHWVPWVGISELARMWLFALDDERVEGPVNAVGPTPCTNREYTKALGRVLRRPTVLPVPVPFVKLALGGQLVDEMLLGSQKATPAKLEALDYEFLDRTVEDALRRELGAA